MDVHVAMNTHDRNAGRSNELLEIRTEMEKMKKEMVFREEEWKKERNEFKGTIEKLEKQMTFNEEKWKRENNEFKEKIERLAMRLEEYDKIEQHMDMVQVKQEDNSMNVTSDAPQLQTIQPSTSRMESTRGNDVDNSTAGTSGTSENAQGQNSNVSKPSGSNNPNVSITNTSDNRENNTSLLKSENVNRSGNETDQSAPGDSRNIDNTTNTNNDNDEIKCYCDKTAIQLTVRKDGPTKGRLFYKCSNKLQGKGGCKFFFWASDSAKAQVNTANKQSSSVSNLDRNNTDHLSRAGTSNNDLGNTSANDVTCNCDQLAIKLTVHKDGPNKGRQFYGCPKGRNIGCNFFKWADEDDANDESTNGGNSTTRGTWNNVRRPSPQKEDNAAKRRKVAEGERKCGNCRLKGHTRTTCPNGIAVPGIFIPMGGL
ncbi:PREDICTED: DNA topoisomerase 3-alpha-like [Wasmannia auropunctata]|uniref:DNA topoisomerase 3-alpha-like n=1 Tax=Wasmannia auropunctata TaxID=64793 RepID=UPI0005F0A039|nr:PREDICTED: DNA topoisomerase 3-alpha-like [Wasmannia auropunctata]